MKKRRKYLKRFKMQYHKLKFIGVFHESISHIKKALFYLSQQLQSFFRWNRDDIRGLLITYTANVIAWVSVYSNYLPAPVKVVWVIFTSYYRRSFVDDDDASRKSEATYP
jgi:hypothetical protein